MGLLSRFRRKKTRSQTEVPRESTEVEEKDQVQEKSQPANPHIPLERASPSPSHPQATLIQSHQQQNRDFLYGVGYGSFKSDFDDLKEKLRKIHEDMANQHSLILGKTEDLTEDNRVILGKLDENRKKLGLLIEKAELYSAQHADSNTSNTRCKVSDENP